MSGDNIEKLAGRVILRGFEGPDLPDFLAAQCESGALGGVVLFSRNIQSQTQVTQLLAEIKQRSAPHGMPLIGVDQEGGRVARLRADNAGCTHLPAAREMAALGNPFLTQSAGRLVGAELNALGFNLNFAPVLDVDTHPDSPIIGDRAFGSSVKTVISHGLAFARGLKSSGIVPCAKHFPGHGDASVDSHLALPTVAHGLSRLTDIEMEPFAAWSKTGLGPVMTAHVMYPCLDTQYPATASRKILTDLLQKEIGFKGVIFTDDLEMGAISQLGGAEKFAVNIIKAGAHGLLICKDASLQQKVQTALAKEARINLAFAQKLTLAASKLKALGNISGPTMNRSWIGSQEHKEYQRRILKALNEEGL